MREGDTINSFVSMNDADNIPPVRFNETDYIPTYIIAEAISYKPINHADIEVRKMINVTARYYSFDIKAGKLSNDEIGTK